MKKENNIRKILINSFKATRRAESIENGTNDRRFASRSIADKKKEANKNTCRKDITE